MKTPTIRELKRISYAVAQEKGYTGALNADAGLRGVLDALQPVVAEAFAAGDRKIPGYGERPEGYAARIIAQLKGESCE